MSRGSSPKKTAAHPIETGDLTSGRRTKSPAGAMSSLHNGK